jgi:hypothetical protein
MCDPSLLPLYATSGPASVDAAPTSDAGSLAREAWLGLAGAAHHHAYELAPNASELRRLAHDRKPAGRDTRVAVRCR